MNMQFKINILFNLGLNNKYILKSFFLKNLKQQCILKEAIKYSEYLQKCQKNFINSKSFISKYNTVAKSYLNNGAYFYQDEVTVKIGKLILNKMKNKNNKLNWNVNKNSNKVNLTSDVLKSFRNYKGISKKLLSP